MNNQAMEAEFLSFSNVFETELVSQIEVATADRLFSMVKNGTFGYHRAQILSSFRAVGGTTASGAPANLTAVLKLCLEVAAESNKTAKQAVRLWFDPFTGRLELETANGLTDSLSVFSPVAIALS